MEGKQNRINVDKKNLDKGEKIRVYNTLAALISSSARHSAIVLMFLKAASRAPVHNNQIAWLTRRRGETSTAWRRTVPARPILVESSRGPELMMAVTNTLTQTKHPHKLPNPYLKTTLILHLINQNKILNNTISEEMSEN